MLTKKEISDYYKTAKLDLEPNPQWRLFKIQCHDGKWKIIRNQIRNPEQLRKILVKEAPINVFCSTSTWLNPLNIEKRSYKYADHLFLDNLVFVDIDEHNESEFNAVKRFFRERERYTHWKDVNSGNGYGLYYFDTKKIEDPDPLKRLELVTRRRKRLAQEMKHAGINFDWRMLVDPYRISRVIGTLNDGEKICHEIDGPLSFSRETKNWSMKGKSLKALKPHHNTVQTGGQAGDRDIASWKLSDQYFFVAIDAQINGTRNKYCIFIIKPEDYKYRKFIKLLKKLQILYKLSDFYIFETKKGAKKYYTALCLKGVDKERLLKILRRSRSINFGSFKKYNHAWIKTSRSIGNNGEVMNDQPVFKKVLEYDRNRHHFHSKPHLDYLNSIGVKTEKYKNLFGNQKQKKIIALMKI